MLPPVPHRLRCPYPCLHSTPPSALVGCQGRARGRALGAVRSHAPSHSPRDAVTPMRTGDSPPEGALGAQAGGHAAAFTVTDPSSLSVLSRFASNGYVKLKPYPYLVVNHALPPELYRALEANFLTDTAILALNGETERKQNFRYDVPATKLLGQGAAQHVTSLWQQFARYHTSRAFYDEVDAILGPHIRKLHPLKPNFRTGVRYNDSESEVLMDCQVAMNAPVKTKSAVRGPHLDGPAEMWAGLLYFRHSTDSTSHGGDLQVLECKKKQCVKMPKNERARYGTGDTHFKPEDVHVRATVPYRANQFVLFVNGPNAIHGVTPRSVTHFSRRLVNVVAVRRGAGKLG